MACCKCCCENLGKYCCNDVCQETPCGDCETDEDCAAGQKCCVTEPAEGEFVFACEDPQVADCLTCKGCPTYDTLLGQLSTFTLLGPFADFFEALAAIGAGCNGAPAECGDDFYVLECCP